jgi:hypothetical protein
MVASTGHGTRLRGYILEFANLIIAELIAIDIIRLEYLDLRMRRFQ